MQKNKKISQIFNKLKKNEFINRTFLFVSSYNKTLLKKFLSFKINFNKKIVGRFCGVREGEGDLVCKVYKESKVIKILCLVAVAMKRLSGERRPCSAYCHLPEPSRIAAIDRPAVLWRAKKRKPFSVPNHLKEF